ncbi:hypothetical protein [Streptomyces sp. CB03238]|uniref:hypothetical protein n=1 Tax=Streptomyces sp. CB03238 TaxID=1907777 RepID=UPI000A111B3E|nr:hypothetical protein [Streptomyces sp. CB03238]ORT53322.1 hypothetical protein BKD26_38695 [Streptomyces sp. CB03238]
MPEPKPSSETCDLVQGPAGDLCRGDGGGRSVKAPETPEALDPLTAFAHSCADGAAWVMEQLGKSITGAGAVDFTTGGFLAQYAIVFAASTVLTLVLWLIAVAKRAMRGVPLTTAAGEAIGFLWLTVAASAFTPLILHVVVGAVDGVTTAVAGTGDASSAHLFTSMAATLRAGGENLGGGPIILLITSFVTIVLGGLLWVELVLRAAALYLGAILGTVVYAGLVDRDLWGKVRRWAGVMIAIILIKPVIVCCLGVASVFTSEEGPNTAPVVVAGLVVIILALFASVQVFRFVPGYGDDIASGLAARAAMTGGRLAKSGVRAGVTAAGIVTQGIQTHGSRPPRQSGPSQGKSNGSVNGVSQGIQKHGSRGGSSKPKK